MENKFGESHGKDQRLSPIISSHALIDPDTGLFKLIVSEDYLNPDIFDPTFFSTRSESEVVSELYFRSERNPLYLIAKEGVDKTLLDEYYEQFLAEKYEDIMLLSNSTELITFVYTMMKSGEINPTILYYKEEELNQLLIFDDFVNVNMIRLDELITNIEKYGQFFVKDIKELEPLADQIFKCTIYLSDSGLNFDKNANISDLEIASKIIQKRNDINVFSMYDHDVVNREKIRR